MKFERPTYLISREICESNIRTMASKAERAGVIFRPHFKTHQSLAIGRWFREAGVTRITVSSLGAARYFARDGWNDITVAFPVNLREMSLINDLASRVRIGLLVEDPEVASTLEEQLAFPADTWLKIDTGYHRTGLMPEEMPVISRLAAFMERSRLLNLKGLLTHAGHTYQAGSPEKVKEIFFSSAGILNTVKGTLGDDFGKMILSYGDTPSCSLMQSFPGIDEIRPGNFIFYDLMQLNAGSCVAGQIAGIVVCPVVAVHPTRNQVVLYGGAIHLSKEFIEVNGRRVYGQLVEMDDNGWYDPIPGAYLVSLSQEHGVLEAPDQIIKELRPGKLVGVIPVHACLAANLLQGYQLLGGEIADYFNGI
jgi:D-serine deaminase-like pyridoxal phosphate-dependent protein